MRAWVLDSPGGKVRCDDVAEPASRGGGAIVRVLAAHLPAYTAEVVGNERGTIPAPLVLGPTCVGRVESVAEDVFNVRPGDVVLANSLLGSGDVAEPEEVLIGWTGVGGRGRTTATTTGMQAVWRDGVFAERALCPKETLLRLPDADDHPDPARLACLPWLAISAEGLNRADQRPGQSVVVLGATGHLGTAAVLVALARGASRVVATGRNETALTRLSEMDSRVTAVALTGERAQNAAAIGEADVVIDALGPTPTAEPTLTGFDALRPGGTMVLLGGVRRDLPLPYGDIMRRRLTLRGSWLYPPDTALDVWRMVRSGVLPLDALDVHETGLDDPAGAIARTAGTSGLEIVALVPG
jgi:threonine dehydrogenase-like Zn-dependent dehydrogenase